jgi:hypothetical protein
MKVSGRLIAQLHSGKMAGADFLFSSWLNPSASLIRRPGTYLLFLSRQHTLLLRE